MKIREIENLKFGIFKQRRLIVLFTQQYSTTTTIRFCALSSIENNLSVSHQQKCTYYIKLA
jgi:hypothetical protein